MANQNENRELAIKLTDVKKMYKLGQIGGGTLKADLESWWAKKRGLEDPNTKIGEQRLIGQTFMALNGIDLEVYKGEALGIIGGNGAGKSTMLKLLSRVTAPTSGKIQIWGRIASMLEVGTGFNGEMTGRENIYMNGAILGMTKAEIDAKMEDIIEFSEVRDFIDTPVKRYSSGMYVKLAFSVAAHLDSEIMIMDEVLAVGDMAFQKKCLDKMRDAAKKEGRTVLYVSHNMNTIRQLCDRCVVLEKGKIIFSGSADDAIQRYMRVETSRATSVDYQSVPRLHWLSNTYIRTLSARYLNKQDVIFSPKEGITLEIKWRNERKVRDLSLRMEVLKLDRTPVATFFLNNFYSGEADEVGQVRVFADINMLASGHYTSNYTFFIVDDFGNATDVDCVHGLSFDIDLPNDIVWNTKAWGFVKMPELQEVR